MQQGHNWPQYYWEHFLKCNIFITCVPLLKYSNSAVGDANTSNDWASDVDECARITKWLGDIPLGGIPRFGPKPRRTMSWSGGVYATFQEQLICLPLLDGVFFVSGCVACFQSPGVPYGADVLRRAGDVRTWRFQNIHNPTAKNGII